MKRNITEKLCIIMLVMMAAFAVTVAVKSGFHLVQRCRQSADRDNIAVSSRTGNPRECEVIGLLDAHLRETVSADFPEGSVVKPAEGMWSLKGIRHHAACVPGHVTDTLFHRVVKITVSYDGDDPSDRTDYVIIQYLWASQDEPDYIEIYSPADLPDRTWQW